MNDHHSAISRRSFFQAGGISLCAIPPLGLSLQDVLAAESSTKGKTRINVIFMFLQGGASQLDMYDMKPKAPSEIRGPYLSSSTRVPGFELSDQLPLLAQHTDKFSLIRSMHTFTSKHGEGDVHIMCGTPVDKNLQGPGIGAVLSKQQPQTAHIPPFIHFGDMKHPAYSAPGFAGILGRSYDPFVIKQDPNSASFRVREFDVAEDVDINRLSGRRSLLQSLDKYQAQREAQLPFAREHDEFTGRALSLATSRKTKEAFDLSRETESTRERYGRNSVGQGMLMARRLVEAGVRFVTIQGYVDTGIYAWDHHWGIFPHMDIQLPIYDRSYSALLEDLDQRGMLETTLVITAGEFGRTPRINDNKRGPGRDHWGRCFSLTLGGGGVATGKVIGTSDKYSYSPQDRPVSVPDFVATIYEALGMDPNAEIVSQGRPVKMLPDGSPVRELL